MFLITTIKRASLFTLRGHIVALLLTFTLPLSTTVLGIKVYPFDLVLLPLVTLSLVSTPWIKNYTFSSLDLFFLIFCIFFFFSIIINGASLSDGLMMSRGYAVFVVCKFLYRTTFHRRDVVNAATALALVQSSLGCLQSLLQSNVGALNQYFGSGINLLYYETVLGKRVLQAQGTFSSPNVFALWLSFLTSLAIYGQTEYSSYRRMRGSSLSLFQF